MQRRHKKSTTNNKNARKNHKKGGRQVQQYHVRVPRATPGFPDSETVFLKFRADFYMYGVNPAVARFVTNGAYDVDPLLGGFKYEYFDNYSAIYAFNRVESYKVDLTMVNIESAPIRVDLFHLNIDPTVSAGPSTYAAYSLMPYGKSMTMAMSQSGGSKIQYTKVLPVQRVVGDRQTITSERYVGSSTANPADLTYFGWSVYDTVGSLANGVAGTLIITAKVKFYDRKNVAAITADREKEIQRLVEERLNPKVDKIEEKKKGLNSSGLEVTFHT